MNKLEFLSEMNRVLAFWPRPNAEKEPGDFKDYNTWLDVIYKKVDWIDSMRFAMVVEVLLDVRPRFRKDLDHRKIIAIYRDLSEQKGWGRPVSRQCQTCLGFGWIGLWLEDHKGLQFRAVKGCGTCNQKYSNIHPEFKDIDCPFPEMNTIDIDKLRRIPPSYAQTLLTLADMMGHQPKEQIVDALAEAARQIDAGRREGSQPAIKTHLDTVKSPIVRRNELVQEILHAPPPPVPEPEPVLVTAAAPAEEEETPFEPDKTVNPNVANVPQQLREQWTKEKSDDEIPFILLICLMLGWFV